MSSLGSEIFDMVKDDSRLEELKSKLNSQGAHLGCKRNNDGETLLHCAVQDKKARRTVKELVDHFKPRMPSILACRTKKGYSPLHLVAEHGDLPMMEEMLEGLSTSDRLEVLRVKDIRGRTPVHWAAAKDKTDIVKYMLQSVSVDAHLLLSEKNSSGETTLHETAGRGRGTLLDLMLSMVPTQRFDLVMNKDNKGRNLLIHAVIGEKSEAVELLLRDLTEQQIFQIFSVAHSGGQNPFHIAMEKNNLAALKILLTTLAKFQASDQKELLRSKDAQGLTCLHIAVKEKSHKALSVLLEFIQPKEWMKVLCERNHSGNTALHKAVSKKDAEATKIIITSVQATKRHQLISQTNCKQQSVLQYAVVKQHAEMVKQLLEYCDPVHLRELFVMTDVTGDTLLHDSSSREVFQITAHLLDAMSTSHDRYELATYSDRLYRTALHRAVMAKNVESVKCILDKLDSAERFKLVKQKHQEGQSPIAVAIALNQPEIIKAIMNYFTAAERKDILLQRDLSHATPLHNACSSDDSGGIASGSLEGLQNKMKKLLQGISSDSGTAKAEENPKKENTNLIKSLIDTLDVATKGELLKCKSLQGQNVLHAAASNCSLATLQYLVDGVSAHALLDLLLEKDEDGCTALSSACVNIRKENVQFMLNTLRNCEGKERLILAQDLQGNTVLHLAMKADSKPKLLKGIFGRSDQNDLPITAELVQSIVDNINQDVLSELLKVKNVKGKTLLQLAMKTKASNAANVILGKIPQDVALCLAHEPDLSGRTPLQSALETPEMMRLLLGCMGTHKYESLTNINEDRQSYLHLAAQQKGRDDALFILDSLGLSFEEQLKIMALRDCHGRTFLHLAASMNVKLLRKFVQSEIHKKFIVSLLCVRDDQGRTVSDSAEDKELKQEIQKLLEEAAACLSCDAIDQLLCLPPVPHSSKEILKRFLGKRDPQTKQTKLHMTAQWRNADVMHYIERKLDKHDWIELLNARDWLGNTAIHTAAQSGSVLDYVNNLEKTQKQELFAALNVWGENCLHLAIRSPSSSVVTEMIKGIDRSEVKRLLEQKDFKEQTVLHAAAKTSMSSVSTILAASGPTAKTLLEQTDAMGCSAASVAVSDKLRKYMNTFSRFYHLYKPMKCIIFFVDKDRKGAGDEKDIINLEFIKIKMQPEVKKDPLKVDIFKLLNGVSEDQDVSGLIVVIMAHGDKGCIFDYDDQRVDIDDIISAMCTENLKDKPKLLLVQACQGEQPPGKKKDYDDPRPGGGEGSKKEYDPHVRDPDILVQYATVSGEKAVRNHFIKEFSVQLDKSSEDDDVITLLEQTHATMKDASNHRLYQKPSGRYVMPKKLALKRVWLP